jgi:hypothetical protein
MLPNSGILLLIAPFFLIPIRLLLVLRDRASGYYHLYLLRSRPLHPQTDRAGNPIKGSTTCSVTDDDQMMILPPINITFLTAIALGKSDRDITLFLSISTTRSQRSPHSKEAKIKQIKPRRSIKAGWNMSN